MLLLALAIAAMPATEGPLAAFSVLDPQYSSTGLAPRLGRGTVVSPFSPLLPLFAVLFDCFFTASSGHRARVLTLLHT